MTKFFCCFFMILWGMPSVNLSAQNLRLEALPEWVVPIHPEITSSFSRYDINGGVYNSLIDYQVNFREEADFYHYAYKIVNEAGISVASEISIPFDSSYQWVQFHYLYVWRNGEKEDRTDELTFELINTEQDLQNNIYYGLITAYEVLEDIRKGDMVEYAYTLMGDNPIFGDYSYRFFAMEEINPIDYYSLRLLYPVGDNFIYDCRGCDDLEISEDIIDKETKLIQLTQASVEAFEFEETTPVWHTPYRHLVISNFKDWGEVVMWALQVFEVDENQHTAMDRELEDILKDYNTQEDTINAILNYVQNDIRFMGMENGIGSIKPFPPGQVIKQRFGDCKDKSLLLVSLLERAGIDSAYPVLVNSMLYKEIAGYLPGAQLFDHCIVLLQYKGKDYWLDPTISLQGGSFHNRRTPDYGHALVVKDGARGLVEMEVLDTFSRTEVRERLSVPSFSENATLIVVSRMYGSNADFFRNLLEYFSAKELSKEFMRMYGILYPNIVQLDRVQIRDDTDSNIITTIESYEIADIWKENDQVEFPIRKLYYEPISLYSYITSMACETKKYPVEVPFPNYFKQTTTITVPDNFLSRSMNIDISNYAFDFEQIGERGSDASITLSYLYRTKVREVPPGKFNNVCRDLNKVVREIPLEITLFDKEKLELQKK